jgi:hypothetical protein
VAAGNRVSTTANNNAAMFVSIAPLLATLTQDVTAVNKVHGAVKSGGTVATGARNVALKAMKVSYRAFVAGVQGLCDAAPDLEHAMALASAAGLDVKKRSVQTQDLFHGKALGNGSVKVYARLSTEVRALLKKSTRVYWEWQMSTDGGLTWASLPGTNYGNTLVNNLTPGAKVNFRHRTTVKNTVSDWSKSLPIRVL